MNVLQIQPSQATALQRLGVIYYDSGRVARAFELLRRAQEANPESIDLRVRVARLYLLQGQTELARAQALKILEKDPGHEQGVWLAAATSLTPEHLSVTQQLLDKSRTQLGDRAIFHVGTGTLAGLKADLPTAEAEFDKARAMEPKSSLIAYVGAVLHWQLGNPARADELFKAAIELAPAEDWETRLKWAEFKFSRNDLVESRKIIEGVLSKSPRNRVGLLLLARMTFSQRNTEECLALVQRMLQENPGDAEALLLRAQVTLSKGDVNQAVAELERLRDQYPRVVPLHFQLATAYLKQNAEEKAIDSFRAALKVDPRFDQAALALGEISLRKRDYTAAKEAIGGVLKRSPKNPQALVLMAETCRLAGQFEEALAVAEQWKQLVPKMPEPYYQIGIIRRQQQQEAQAQEAFEEAVRVAPRFSPAVEQLIEMDLRASRSKAALDRAEALVRNLPGSAGPLIVLARVHLSLRELDAAEAALRKALEVDPNSSAASMLLTQLYVQSKKLDQAQAELKTVLTKQPTNATVLLQLGWLQQDSKNFAGARESYERLLQQNPRSVTALNNLAVLSAENLGDLDAALRYAKAARELAPDDPAVADTFGWILCRRRDYPWALSTLRTAAEKRPTDAEVQYHLGTAYYMMGDDAAARLALQTALDITNSFPGHVQAQARLQILGVNPSSATAADRAKIQEAMAADPQDVMALLRSAELARRDGNPDTALKFYRDATAASPKAPLPSLQLARFYAEQQHDSVKSTETANAALELAPSDLGVTHAVAEIALLTGDYKRAHSLMQPVIRQYPEDPKVLFDFAIAAYGRGKVSEAEQSLQHALGTKTGFPQAELARQLLDTMMLARDPARVRAVVANLKTIPPADPRFVPALMAMAALFEFDRQDDAARKIYSDQILKLNPGFAPAWRQLAFLYARTANGESQAFDAGMKAREVFAEDADLEKLLGQLAFRSKDYPRAVEFLKASALKRPQDAELFLTLGLAHKALDQKDQSKAALQTALASNPSPALTKEVNRILAELK